MGNSDHVIYPRFAEMLQRSGGTEEIPKNTQLPSIPEIELVSKQAKEDATRDLNNLRVCVDGSYKCFDFDNRLAYSVCSGQNTSKVKSNDAEHNDRDDSEEIEMLESEIDDEDENDWHDMDILRSIHETDFKDFSHKVTETVVSVNESLINATAVFEKSKQFLQVPDWNGKLWLVKKVLFSGFVKIISENLATTELFE